MPAHSFILKPLFMENVADVLRHKYPQFNTIRSNRSILDALHQMHCENVDYLIVMDDERFLGVLTEHGLAEKLSRRQKDLDTVSVKEFMTTYLPVATVSDSLECCIQLMERHNVRHLAIYDRFTFKGVVCSHDLMKQMLLKRRATFEEDLQNNYRWTY